MCISHFDTYFAQPSVFFTLQALKYTGALREDLHYAMDLDLWLRMARHARITFIEQHLSWMRDHKDAKTWRYNALRVLEEAGTRIQAVLPSRLPWIREANLCTRAARRSQAWVAVGRHSITSGDRKNAWLAAYTAARVRVGTIGSRGWMGLVLRLAFPRTARRPVFRLGADDAKTMTLDTSQREQR